jgi:tetratricopeptide (TPR) repeat protein
LTSDDVLLTAPGFDWYVAELYTAMGRFLMWDEILAEPVPNSKLIGLTGAYLYAKTTALAAKGRVDEAKSELAELEKLAGSDGNGDFGRVKAVLAVAILNAKARIAVAEGNKAAAIGLLRDAAAKEDRLAYSEPADWFFPTRHLLGSVLIEARQVADAEAAYRDDLSRLPDNGWALYGLAQSLRMQGRGADAQRVRQQFDRTWRNADVTPVASAF